MSLLNDVDRDYSDNWVISVDKWNSYRSIGYQNKLDISHIQSANVSAIGTNSQYATLSGGLSAHGDVSGLIGFDPTQNLNYTVDVNLNRFTLNGELQPDLNLYRGLTYNFNQSDIDNIGQRMFVSNDISGRLVASHTYTLLAGGNGSENSNTLRGTGGNDGVVSSNNWSSGYTLSRVFNGTLSDAGDGWHTANNTYPANLIFTFPNPVIIYKYKLWPRQRGNNASDTHPPKLWQLRGVSLTNINDYDQNDSSTYTVLHDQTVPQSWNVDWFNAVQTSDITNDTKRQEYIFSTPGLYKHYILHVIQSQYGTSGNTFIGEIAYYGGTPASYSLSENSAGFITTGTLGTDLLSSWTIPTDASDTMYYASDGSDNAGGIINIANVQYYDLSHVYDNSDSTFYKSPLGIFNNQNLISGKDFAVKIDFQSSKKILKYDINNTSLKSWTLRGTDNSHNYDRTDSNTYEVLHSKTDFSYIMNAGSGSIDNVSVSYTNNSSKTFDSQNIFIDGAEACIVFKCDESELSSSPSYSTAAFDQGQDDPKQTHYDFTLSSNAIAEILIIGGGGGGGRGHGGGGGAGGVLHTSSVSLTAGNYNVKVGRGGGGAWNGAAMSFFHTWGGTKGNRNSGDNGDNAGAKGSNSSFDTIEAEGGGGANGHGSSTSNPTWKYIDGGSGGGGDGWSQSKYNGDSNGINSTYAPSVTQYYGQNVSFYGNNGGNGQPAGNGGGGGGGGAGTTGQDLTGEVTNMGAAGGDGVYFANFTHNKMNSGQNWGKQWPSGHTNQYNVGAQPDSPDYMYEINAGWFGGGGGGGTHMNGGNKSWYDSPGGKGGGGDGARQIQTNNSGNPGGTDGWGRPGVPHTGGGGGGGADHGNYGGGHGGTGVVIIRLSFGISSDNGGGSTAIIVPNPKDYTYYVLDATESNNIDSALIGEMIFYDDLEEETPATNVFNGTLVDASDAYISNTDVFSSKELVSGKEFSIHFEFSEPKYITRYRIWPQINGNTNSPSSWTLRGCNDKNSYNRNNENTYTKLDLRIEQEEWSSTTSNSITNISGFNEYFVTNPGYYSYYVLDVTASNNDTFCSIGEIAYYENNYLDVTSTSSGTQYLQHNLTINNGTSNETSDFEVAEIIVFNKELSIDEENTMIDYLKHIYYGADENDPIGNTETLHIPRKNIKMGDIYSILDASRQTFEYFNKNFYDNVLINRLINSGEKIVAGAGAIDGTGDLSGNIMIDAFRGALSDSGQDQLFTGDQGSSLLTFVKNLTTLGGYSNNSMIGSGRNIQLYLKYKSTGTDPGNPVLNEIIVNGNTYALNTTNAADMFHYTKWQTSVATNNSIYNNYITWQNVENISGPTTGATWNYSDVSGLYYEQKEIFGVTGTGGNIVNSYGSYNAHIYTSSGQFTIPSSSNLEFLIVGGGGAGGFALAGGGGGGGVIIATKYTLPAGTYNITVGAGGIGQNHKNSHAPDGGNSSIIGNGVSFIAPGGGGGGGANNNNVYIGNPGGSGAGHEGWNSDKSSAVAQYYNSSGSLTTLTGGSVEIVPGVTAYGNPGGPGGRSHRPTGGGGAGEPGIGNTGGTNVQAHGGDGIQNNFYDGTTDYYWAGGGGGTQWSNDAGSGRGGKGGGAAGAWRAKLRGANSTGPPESLNAATGSADYDGADAGVNTGGGGGGGEWSGGDGGNGGSGIVIIRLIQLSAKNLDGVYLRSPPITVTNDEFTLKMYGNGSGMGTVSVGSHIEDHLSVPTASPQKAFNNNVSDGWIGAETILPGYSSIKEQDLIFVFPDEARVSKYRIWPRDIVDGLGNPPKSWTLRGEKKNSAYDPLDSSTYDLLDTQNNITSWSIPNSSSIVSELDYNEYFISNTEWYQKYILHITDVYWTSVSTSTLEAGAGSLDGTGGAQGTARSYYSHSNMPDYKAFDGTITNANADAWHSNEAGGSNYVLNYNPELGFEFPNTETKKITKYRIWARGGITSETSQDNWRPRAWQLRAASSYANYNSADSSTYTVIDTVASLGAAGNGTAGTSVWPYINSVVTLPDGAGYLEFNVDTPGNYNYYVLHFTESFNWSGSTTSYIALSQLALYSSINTGTVEIDTTPGVGELAYYGYLKSEQTDISSVPIKTTDFLDVSYVDVFGEENQITNTSNIKISAFGGLGGSASGGSSIPVTEELSFWGDAESWIVGTGWTDKSAAGNNIYTGQPGVAWYNSSLTSITNPDVVSENGADNITKVIQGGTNERFRFNTNILTPDTSEPGNPYTFIHITRYNGNNRNRIWSNSESNYASGFHGGKAGRGSHINGPSWVGYGWNNGSTGQYVYPTDPRENPSRGGDIDWAKDYWLLTTEQGGLTRWYVKFNAGGYGAPGSNGNLYNNREALHNSQNTESPHISINYYSNEVSQWQVAFAAVWKRHLTDDEVDLVEAWLIKKYQFNYFNL